MARFLRAKLYYSYCDRIPKVVQGSISPFRANWAYDYGLDLFRGVYQTKGQSALVNTFGILNRESRSDFLLTI